MTNYEKVVLTAYTGYYLCNDFNRLLKYASDKLGRTVMTHDLGDPEIMKELQNASREDLMEILRE